MSNILISQAIYPKSDPDPLQPFCYNTIAVITALPLGELRVLSALCSPPHSSLIKYTRSFLEGQGEHEIMD